MEKKTRTLEKSNFPKGVRKGAYIFCYLMALPALYGIIRYFIVNANSILLAFSEGEVFKSAFTLSYFRAFFTDISSGSSSEMMIALKNTIYYFLMGIFKLFLCYLIAYFIYKKIPGYKIYTFILFLPSVIAPVISVFVFKSIIRVEGPVYMIWKALTGLEYDNLLFYSSTATKTILVFQLLNGFGTTYLILVGAMKRIPVEVIESAKLDGCSGIREFFQIILPLTWGTFSTFLLMSTAMIFSSSGPILYFTNGAAKTSTIGFWIFDQVRGSTYNYPAAVGLIFTVLGLPVVMLCWWLSNKIDSEVSY